MTERAECQPCYGTGRTSLCVCGKEHKQNHLQSEHADGTGPCGHAVGRDASGPIGCECEAYNYSGLSVACSSCGGSGRSSFSRMMRAEDGGEMKREADAAVDKETMINLESAAKAALVHLDLAKQKAGHPEDVDYHLQNARRFFSWGADILNKIYP